MASSARDPRSPRAARPGTLDAVGRVVRSSRDAADGLALRSDLFPERKVPSPGPANLQAGRTHSSNLRGELRALYNFTGTNAFSASGGFAPRVMVTALSTSTAVILPDASCSTNLQL